MSRTIDNSSSYSYSTSNNVKLPPIYDLPDGSASNPSLSFSSNKNTGIYLDSDGVLGFSANGINRFTLGTSFTTTSLIKGANGFSATPSYSFVNSPTTGMFLDSINVLGFSCNSSEVMSLSASELALVTQLQTSDGTAALPAYSFISDNNSGFYRVGADNVGISTNGVNRLSISTAAIIPTIPLLAQLGSTSAPAYSFSGDSDTGVWSSEPNNLSISTGGILKLAVIDASLSSSQVRIYSTTASTSSTTGALRVDGGVGVAGALNVGGQTLLSNGTVGAPAIAFTGDPDTGIFSNGSNNISFSTNGVSRMFIADSAVVTTNDFTVLKTTAYLQATSSDDSFGTNTGGLRITAMPKRCSGIQWGYTGDANRGVYLGAVYNGGSNVTSLTLQASTSAFASPGSATPPNELLRVHYDSGEFRYKDGTVAAPIFSFLQDTNSGLYRIGSDNIGVSCNATLSLDINASRVYIPSALTLLTSGGTAASLSHYEEYSATFNIDASNGGSFSTTTVTTTIRITRIGKGILLSGTAFNGTIASGKIGPFITGIPSRFRPMTNRVGSIPVLSNSVANTGYFNITTGGNIEYYPTSSSEIGFTADATYGVLSYSCCYTVA